MPTATVFLEDPALLHWQTSAKLPLKYQRFLDIPSVTRAQILHLHVEKEMAFSYKIAAEELLHSKKLPGVTPTMLRLRDVIRNNAFPMPQPGGRPRAGIFLTAARLNHSCLPNADLHYDPSTGRLAVFTNRPVAADEELTISYIDNSRQRDWRLHHLSAWHFLCRCPACDIEHPDSAVHERRLERFYNHRQETRPELVQQFLAKAKYPERIVEAVLQKAQAWIRVVHEHHSLWKFAREAYKTAFDLTIELYKLTRQNTRLREAQSLLEVARQWDMMYAGVEGRVTKADRELLATFLPEVETDRTSKLEAELEAEKRMEASMGVTVGTGVGVGNTEKREDPQAVDGAGPRRIGKDVWMRDAVKPEPLKKSKTKPKKKKVNGKWVKQEVGAEKSDKDKDEDDNEDDDDDDDSGPVRFLVYW